MLLLDTNICVFVMKNRHPEVTRKLLSHHPSEIAISSVTVYELEYGAARSSRPAENRQNLRLFLAPFTILPFDTADAIAAGEIRRRLESAGTPIGPYDLQIAAQGLARGLTVVTRNTGEFTRVPGLRVTDWL